MRQLLPHLVDPVDPASVYADLPSANHRPAVRLNMIASIDGATAIAGRSGGLGGDADQKLFRVLRTLADVVLVAAGTVRGERYGPSAVPLAIVTRSCQLDLDSPLFTCAPTTPLVFTVTDAPPDRRKQASRVADVIIAGEHDVDLRRVLSELGFRGHRAVLAEGGPTLNAQLAAADLIDELCLTISPQLVSGDARRILAGPLLPSPHQLRLLSLCEQDGFCSCGRDHNDRAAPQSAAPLAKSHLEPVIDCPGSNG
jgi:riboflavin biosynthesis pyrimidine reductase